MKHIHLILILFCLVPFVHTIAQVDSMKFDGIKIVVPSKEKAGNTYFFISTGYQFPSWCRVPMIPENARHMNIKGDMNVKVPGWFAGIGIIKKTKTHFEAGLLVDFYTTSIPVAYSGQRSTSEWVYAQNNYLSYFTQIFDNSIHRKSEVISFRASIRYKLPLGRFQFWGGLAPGTFSSTIKYSEENNNEPIKTYRVTTIGLNFQAGIDLIKKNKKGNDMLRFTIFSDFFSPEIEEKMISLFNPGWNFINSEGNYVINPFRLGFALGIQ